jgi:hypothetical protein
LPSDIFTRPDTDPTYQTLFEHTCTTAIDPQFLCLRSAKLFHSLKTYIKHDCPLSEAQFAALKNIKSEHDWRKRSDAIAKAEHERQQKHKKRKFRRPGDFTPSSIETRTDQRLNRAFNPVGR